MILKPIIGAGAFVLSVSSPIGAIASEVNLSNISQYSSQDQVTSVSQFTDVRPQDWAYRALSSLAEQYGCLAGSSSNAFRGSQAMTRYEAAALLNACLDRVSEVTDELKRLTAEFSTELAIIRGRVNSLEANVASLEATQFSTTSKLRGEANFIVGSVPGAHLQPSTLYPNGQNIGNAAFNYDLRLNLDTSFTGRDLLRTRLRSGNFDSYPFGTSNSILKLDKAENTSNSVTLDRLHYSFPALTDGLTLTLGALVRNTEISWIPTAYRSEILDFFTTAGAPGVYNKATGTGFGAQYFQPGKSGFLASVNYVAENGSDSSSGVFNPQGSLNILAQVGYRTPQLGIVFGYRRGTEGTRVRTFNGPLGVNGALAANQTSNSYAVNAYWQPARGGTIVPSISGGYNWNTVSGTSQSNTPNANSSRSWFAGLQWSDVFAKGNSAGVAYGQTGNSLGLSSDATLLEIFFRYKVSDSISITPAIFHVSDNLSLRGSSSNWGGVIQTKFTF